MSLGFGLVAVSTAEATIQAPANNATVAGVIPVQSSGSSNGGYEILLGSPNYGAVGGNAGCKADGNGVLVAKVELFSGTANFNTLLATPINLTGSASEQHWNNATNSIGTGFYPKVGNLDTRLIPNGQHRLRESLTNRTQGNILTGYRCTHGGGDPDDQHDQRPEHRRCCLHRWPQCSAKHLAHGDGTGHRPERSGRPRLRDHGQLRPGRGWILPRP